MDKTKNESIFNKIKKIKHIEWIVAFVAVGLMLVLYFTSLPSTNKSSQSSDEASSSQDYCIKMEQKILECLSSMKGAGKTRIVINWASSVESVVTAYSPQQLASSQYAAVQSAAVQKASTQNIVKLVYPKALAVVIVCEGGGDVKLRLSMMNVVSILLGIDPNNVVVCGM